MFFFFFADPTGVFSPGGIGAPAVGGGAGGFGLVVVVVADGGGGFGLVAAAADVASNAKKVRHTSVKALTSRTGWLGGFARHSRTTAKLSS